MQVGSPPPLPRVVNMGGIELGSSDKHTQNHTYPRIARNPELRGIRGGSLCQLNPAYQKTLFSSYEMGGGMHCAVQTMFRPCSDSIWLGSDSEFRCALATSYTNVFLQRLHRCEKHDTLPTHSRAKRPILFKAAQALLAMTYRRVLVHGLSPLPWHY